MDYGGIMDEYKNIRLGKLKNWEEKFGICPDRFIKTHSINNALSLGLETKNVSLAGRVMLIRSIGKICFIKLQDFSNTMQIVLKEETLKEYSFILDNLDIGDLIGVQGYIFETQTKEKSLHVENLTLLTKCLHPLPEKWHGITDDEIKLRQRYLDLLVNKEASDRFKFRAKFIKELKNYLEDHDFIAVETPVLQKQASGALATPFATHHKALNIPLYLRISPETYLKRLMAGGYERVYEIGRCFRNEGIDPTHLQEFTMIEFYAAYWNYQDNIKFIQDLLQHIFKKLNVPEYICFDGKDINLSGPWRTITYADLFFENTKLDLNILLQDEKLLFSELSKIIDVSKYKSGASLVDGVYKKYCRPKLVDPIIITHQPAILGPLAKQNIENPLFSDRFQIVLAGLEIVNAYSELVDSELQRKILIEQMNLKAKGEEEAMESEEDFLLAMEYAMPPMSGLGMGIDRMISILTNADTIRDVVFFPSVK